MDYSRLVLTLFGFSAAFFLCLPNLRKWEARNTARGKLEMINKTLEQAELRLMRYEERHDRILGQICSFYLVNPNMEEALKGAREAMDEARDFSVTLRSLQMEMINSFPGEDFSIFDWLPRKSRR